MFTLEGNIYLEVKLAPHLSYAFHIEAQSIKGDVKPPLLMFNSASCYGPRQGTGGNFMRFNGSLCTAVVRLHPLALSEMTLN